MVIFSTFESKNHNSTLYTGQSIHLAHVVIFEMLLLSAPSFPFQQSRPEFRPSFPLLGLLEVPTHRPLCSWYFHQEEEASSYRRHVIWLLHCLKFLKNSLFSLLQNRLSIRQILGTYTFLIAFITIHYMPQFCVCCLFFPTTL